MSKTIYKNKEEELARAPIGPLFLRLSVPMVTAQLVNLLYNIVDRIFVSHIPGEGSAALAGLGVTFPIILLIAGFSALFGSGSSLASIALGQGDKDRSEKILGTAASCLVMVGLILTGVFLLLREPILSAFGASENTLPYASDYLSIYLIGTVSVMLVMGLNPYISAQGFAPISMATTCIGALLNLILDPIFIFGLHMGVRGAALATVMSQTASALWVLRFLTGKKTVFGLKKTNLRVDKKLLFSIAALGVAPFVMQFTECLIQLTMNRGMLQYGSDTHVALMSILFSFAQIVFLPMSGMAQGSTPISSYNFGAGNFIRVKKAFRLAFTCCLGYGIASVSLIVLMPKFFLSIFTEDAAILSMGPGLMRVFIVGFAAMGAQIACQQTFLALGQAKISLFLACLRKVFLLLPLALILPKIGGLGVMGLMLAEPISDFLAAATTTTLFFVKSKRLLPTGQTKA